MISDQNRPARVAYLGHDLDDAAVQRRAALLRGGGMDVRLAGFRRSGVGEVVAGQAAGDMLDLGRTHDARLLQRVFAVLCRIVRPGALRAFSAGAGVVMARNLEMLAIAAWLRRADQRLVYECLDIHRLMLGSGWKSGVLRWLERRLLRRTDLVVVSSPAFAERYFAALQGRSQRVLLVENKVPASLEQVPVSGAMRAERSGVVVIGWFGMLRCRRTLDQLARIVARSQGAIEVVIAGIPSPAEFPNFAQDISAHAGLRYLGQYTAKDLPGLYGQVDFVWAIDYFEEGLNSRWLLPNRLYEGLAHGAVPIALRRVETGRWLARHGVGLLVEDAVEDVPSRLAALTGESRAAMRRAVEQVPAEALFQTAAERNAIVSAITGLAHV